MIFTKYDGNIYIFDSIEEVLGFMKSNKVSVLDFSLNSPEGDIFIINLM